MTASVGDMPMVECGVFQYCSKSVVTVSLMVPCVLPFLPVCLLWGGRVRSVNLILPFRKKLLNLPLVKTVPLSDTIVWQAVGCK